MSQSSDSLEAKVLQLWNQDAEFRAALLNDPAIAMERFLDLKVSPQMDVKVHVSSPTEVHLVLPEPAVNHADGLSLPDQEIEAVGVPTQAGTTFLGTWNQCIVCGRVA